MQEGESFGLLSLPDFVFIRVGQGRGEEHKGGMMREE